MGKASKWFRALLGFKKQPDVASAKPPPKRRWSFVKSYREKQSSFVSGSGELSVRRAPHLSGSPGDDESKHAIAVAAATAAVAEAAVAAAHAAAAVVRLTSSSCRPTDAGFGIREQLAAVKIQSNFRAYLSRRALRALKALVKLQALVRGHIVRKQTADMMRRMQALIRAQARARAGRSQITESPSQSSIKTSHFHHPAGPPTPEKLEQAMRVKSKKYDQPSMLKRNGSKAYAARLMADEEKSDKILEVDPGKPHRRRNLFQSSEQNSHSYSLSYTTSRGSTIQQTVVSPSHSGEVNSQFYPFTKYPDFETEDVSNFCTAESSPQFYSASSVRGPFTPTKSDASRSCLSGYSDHPNYMAYTESSRAKVRSMSAPKQRPQFEVSNVTTTKRYSVYGYGDSQSVVQRGSVLRDGFVGKAYPGSGRLDRLGMPVVGDLGKLDGGGYWNRY